MVQTLMMAMANLRQWAITCLLAETEDLRQEHWEINNNQQETGVDECNVEDNGLHRTWVGEDSADNKEEGLLAMMIATIGFMGFVG